MTVLEFLKTRPCLEEMDGYKWTVRFTGGNIEGEDLAAWLKYLDQIKKGEIIPPPLDKDDRSIIYKEGRKPVPRKNGKITWLSDRLS